MLNHRNKIMCFEFWVYSWQVCSMLRYFFSGQKVTFLHQTFSGKLVSRFWPLKIFVAKQSQCTINNLIRGELYIRTLLHGGQKYSIICLSVYLLLVISLLFIGVINPLICCLTLYWESKIFRSSESQTVITPSDFCCKLH